MDQTRTFTRRLIVIVVAFVIALSGVGTGADASVGDRTGGAAAGHTEQTSDKSDGNGKKCKKKKNKDKKKCKKKDSEEFVPGRTVEIEYTGSAIGSADTPAVYPTGPLFPVNFIPGLDEVLVTIEIIDDVSPNASAGFSYDSDGDGINDTGFDVCGSTPEPVEVIPGTQYNIFPYLLPSTGCTDGVATSGTIIVTFNEV